METLITDNIEIAASFLRSGELVAFPTETVYGLGARIDSDEALQKIFLAKGRPSDNPLIIHISSQGQLSLLTDQIDELSQKLIEHFWPGPLTLIFKKKNSISNLITAGLDTVAVRMPAFDLATRLINKVGIPIAAPSANRSGRPSATSYEHVMNDFNGLIPCILKSNDLTNNRSRHGLESTVVNCSGEQPILLRMGSIPFEEIQKVIPNLIHYQTINSQKENQSVLSEKPLSPGMKYRHYSPQAKVVLIESHDELSLENTSKAFTSSAFIGLEASVDSHSFQNIFQKTLLCSSVEEYAANLFSFFRDCDSEHIQTIFCEPPPKHGLGNTILDRLIKASLD